MRWIIFLLFQLASIAAIAASATSVMVVTVTVVRPAPVTTVIDAPHGAVLAASVVAEPQRTTWSDGGTRYIVVEY